MGKIKGTKDTEDRDRLIKQSEEIYKSELKELNKNKPSWVEDDVMADKQIKYCSKIRINAYEECIEIIDKFIREKQKIRNIFYLSDINEIRNRLVELQEKEDEKNRIKN